MPADATPHSPDARDLCAELRGWEAYFDDADYTPHRWVTGGEYRSIAETVCDAADALAAFRAACEALIDRDPLDAPDPDLTCELCDSHGARGHDSDCPYTMSRAALEKYPEARTDG